MSNSTIKLRIQLGTEDDPEGGAVDLVRVPKPKGAELWCDAVDTAIKTALDAYILAEGDVIRITVVE